MPIEPDNEMTTDTQNKLKIASFRTTDGAWAEFTAAARAIGLTATDVLKAAMEQFVAGEYSPAVNTGISTGVSTSPSISREEIQQLIDTTVSTAVSTAISTQPRHDDVNTDMGMQVITREEIQSLINTAISTPVNTGLDRTSVEEMIRYEIETTSTRIDRVEVEVLIEQSISRHTPPSGGIGISTLTDRVEAIEMRLGATKSTPPEPSPEATQTSQTQYTAKELAQVLKTSTQLLGKWRDDGKLKGLGYKAMQDGRSWVYYAIDTSTNSDHE